MKNKKRNRIYLLILLLLGVTIGFAALATTLKINGNAIITKNSWSVYWANPVVSEGSVTTNVPELSPEPNKTLNTIATWSTTLNVPGDYYEFTIDATNNGTIDAMIEEISSTITDANDQEIALPSYISYKVTYADGKKIMQNHLLPKRNNDTPTIEKYKVRIEFLNTITPEEMNQIPEEGLTYNFNYEVTYTQATSEARPRPKTLEEDSWPAIIENVQEDIGSYDVGDTKTIEMDIDEDGTPETYRLRVANNTTPAECNQTGFSQTACGFVLEFMDVIDYHMMNPSGDNTKIGHFNKGGWEYSDMRAYLNNKKYLEGTDEEVDYTTNGLFNKLPSEIRNSIIDTTVLSGYGSYDSENYTTTDKLYLFSTREIWIDDDGDPNWGINVEDTTYNNTRQLDYYRSQSTTLPTNTTPAMKSSLTGERTSWWLRSAQNREYNAFSTVTDQGEEYAHNSYYELGVSPAFRLAE